MSAEESNPSSDGAARRRPRYGGTHPRRFEDRYKELDPETFPEMQEHVRAQGRTPAGTHVPVLLAEVMDKLAPRPGEVIVDATVGFGGHSVVFLERVGSEGRLIGLDLDAEQLRLTAERWAGHLKLGAKAIQEEPGVWRLGAQICLRPMHFAGVGKALAAEGLSACDVLFADLGVSSMQLDDPARGFSYKEDGPLDMRMSATLRQTAGGILEAISEEELAGALDRFADEPDHMAIARRIVKRRKSAPLKRTKDLLRLVFEAKGIDYRDWRKKRQEGDASLHPAARTFQAIRILVNDELRGLEQFLRVAPYCLRPGGRIGIISFHSGEHERVVQALQSGMESGLYAADALEPVRPGTGELASNPRSRSALFHWARRLP